MDLGAFLRPDADLPIEMVCEGQHKPQTGRLREHRRRPIWLCPSPHPVGRRLFIQLKLPGFKLEEDGSLIPAGDRSEAALSLLGLVVSCRFFRSQNQYILRLKLLGRVLPST